MECRVKPGVHAHGVVVEVVGAAIVPKHFVHLIFIVKGVGFRF